MNQQLSRTRGIILLSKATQDQGPGIPNSDMVSGGMLEVYGYLLGAAILYLIGTWSVPFPCCLPHLVCENDRRMNVSSKYKTSLSDCVISRTGGWNRLCLEEWE